MSPLRRSLRAASSRCLAAGWVLTFTLVCAAGCAHEWEDLRFASDGAAAAGAVGGTTTATGAGQGGGTTSTGGQGGTTATGGSGGGATACQWSNVTDPCPNGFFCDAVNCDDGTCQPLGATESSEKQPVCGCNRVTYWNASVARARGISVEAAGLCAFGGDGCTLDSSSCEAGLVCNVEGGDEKDCELPEPTGECWAMPAQCPDPPADERYVECNASPLLCRGQCELIKQGAVYYHDTQTCN